ncbi:MAG: ABC transporter ATP-binding protein [Gammaproteobacteria bacterium]|nr:ABC transporter ATP-binding protein [Gammaproteobacteria bacterium]
MEPALSIKSLSKTYQNKVVALDGVDLEVKTGDFFALLGPNGAGKSTLIGIVTSLVNKSAGKVRVMGYDIDSHFSQAKSKIGVVPQEFNFNRFEPIMEILANQAGYFGMNRRTARAAAEECLHKLSLWNKRKQTPLQLSGGMNRRLMIARALVHDPELLILDEPTAGVDIEIRRSIWNLMRTINEDGKTIILTTHYLEEAERLCRNIGIIDQGKIIVNTSMRRLLERLKEESFVLYLENPVSEPLDLEDFSYKLIDDRTLEVVLSHGKTLHRLFDILGRQAVTVSSIRNKANRLEELFLTMTGQSTELS